MIAALTNHLWQSTLFVAAAALLAAALRKNGAHVRHAIWMIASLKFLLPFSLLISLGQLLPAPGSSAPAAATAAVPDLAVTVDRIAQPFNGVVFAQTAPATTSPVSNGVWISTALLGIWACGFVVICVMRLRGWWRVRTAVLASVPLPLLTPIPARSSPGLLEPGVVGIWRPLMLLPEGIEQRLTPQQLQAVFAHELCHVRRRDNLMAAMHMLVEAVFWFHPLVWWVGARLVDERERACDEYVLRVCGEPQTYAEGIVNVCKFYVESPVTCVSGVTGSDLKRRIAAIMVNRVGLQLNAARKAGLAMAAILAIVLPLTAGMLTAPLRVSAFAPAQDAGASSNQPAAGSTFDAVSIKSCVGNRPPVDRGPAPPPGFRNGVAPWAAQTSPGYVYWDCATLSQLVEQAYADNAHPLLNTIDRPRPDSLQPKRVRGGPSWIETDKFTVEAKAPLDITSPGLAGAAYRNLGASLPPAMSQALRVTLERRFQLKVHRASEQQDMYALTIAKSGLNKQKVTAPLPGDCQTPEQARAAAQAAPPGSRPAGGRLCGRAFVSIGIMEFSSFTFRQLATFLSGSLDYFVLDRTGIDGAFNFDTSTATSGGGTHDDVIITGLAALGLKIDRTKGPAEYLVVDRVERPRPNAPSDLVEPPSRAQGAGRPR